MADKRIIELDATSELDSFDFLPIDNSKLASEENSGTRKIRVSTLLETTVKVMLTQAEYDELPDTKLTDGKVYYITDESKIIINGTVYGAGGETVSDVYVNGTSVVDANAIAQIKSYKEVTQAEYDALPSSKLTDGVMYCIKDSEFSAEDVPYDNSDSQAQSTNVQDALDEAFQRTIDIGTWFTDVVAESYNYIKHYTVGDYVFNFPSIGVTKLYRCISDTSGAWDSTKWEEVKLSNEVSDEVTLREELESATKVYGTPKNLPQAIATFTDGANLPMPSLKVGIEPIQSGSGDPSPSNVRPISGWTGAEVSVVGVNVWDEEWEVGSIADSNGQNATNNNYRRSKNYISVKANKKYYFNVPNKYGTTYRFYQYKQNKDYIGVKAVDSDGTFETDNDCAFIRFRIATTEEYTNDISINYPSTDTDYHAYNGHTYTIDLDGTRYGGTLDVVSGVLMVDRAEVNMGDLNWFYTSDAKLFTASIQGIKSGVYTDTNLISSIYPVKPMSYLQFDYGMRYNSATAIGVKNPLYTDAQAFKTAMNGVQLVYELATPLTIQLTPTAIKSLDGVNNVWADCGSIKDLKYVRNLNITINDLISRVSSLEG